MKITMLKGLPSSGKTTWANEQIKNSSAVRISRDDIRQMLGGYSPNREKDVLRLRNCLIENAIQMRKNVIVDDTNLNPKHEKYLRQLASKLGVKFEINDSFLKLTPQECIERDKKRIDKTVGADVIWDLYYQWVVPDQNKALNDNSDKQRAVICELKEVLALKEYGTTDYDLDGFISSKVDPLMGCVIDALYNYGVELNGQKYPKIILVTSIDESSREIVELWLNKNDIPYDILLMRDPTDERVECEFMESLYHDQIEKDYAVIGVFESKNSLIRECWQKLGLRVCKVGLLDND